ncbi:MAG: hypothetical protein IT452_05125 [Planctomycetia bacterium]|nr:hypothetical protein [Planctomycetia bacterium]
MRNYEVVHDHKTGKMKVVSWEERNDPFAREAIRAQTVERRARVASLKAWWVALRYAWRDRAQRMRIVGHALFFAGLLVFPLGYAVAVAAASLLKGITDESTGIVVGGGVLALIAFLIALALLRHVGRALFRR